MVIETSPNPFEFRRIAGLDIYIVRDHHYTILPWSIMRQKLDDPPNLISLDHHTDTNSAFLGYRCQESSKGYCSWDEEKCQAMLMPLIERMDWKSHDAMLRDIARLKNDEHISAATLSGILNFAVAINLSDQTPSKEIMSWWHQQRWEKTEKPQPPYTYDLPDDRIFTVCPDCAIGCEKRPHDDDCLPVHYTQVLESFYLDHQLSLANEMLGCCNQPKLDSGYPYILDIDLDYFHSVSAINPSCTKTFEKLARGAVGITIALEPSYVEDGKLPGEAIHSDFLLGRILEILEGTRPLP